MSGHDPIPAFGDRTLYDVFVSAARGCAADQELMCHVTMANADGLPAAASLYMAELWARMATAQGRTSIRLTLAQILGSQALHYAIAGDGANSTEYAAEAVTIFDQLAEEGDPDSIATLTHFFGPGEHTEFRDAVLNRAKEIQAA